MRARLGAPAAALLAAACAVADPADNASYKKEAELAAQTTPSSSPPFTISVTTDNSINGEAFGAPTINAFAKQRVEEQREGAERSECSPRYGQKSMSGGLADARIARTTADGVTLELETASTARGGHFRTCGFCAGSKCVAINGNDTVGSAASRAAARITVRFAADLLYNDYDLRLATAGARDVLVVKVTDGLGNQIARREDGTYPVKASPGSLVFVDAVLEAGAQARGGAPQVVEREAASLDLRVSKAPILALKRGAEPFIVGGEPTKAYPEVVALVLRGKIHCSGTVVAARSVLTAAHCIQGYEADIARREMVVQGGTTISQPTWGPVLVASFNYPDGKNGNIRFNPDRHHLTHDIGLVFVDAALPVEAAALHAGQPSWTAIKPVPIYFVGFGYDKLGTTPFGSGVKREAAWTVDNVDDLRLYFTGSQRNTCRADSGGPAFFIKGGQAPAKLLVGVTSGGDEECTQGFNTRVDAYLAWLTPRLKL